MIGIEHIPELVEESIKNLRNDGLGRALDEGLIKVVLGDGRNPSWNLGGCWDVIHVGAAAPSVSERKEFFFFLKKKPSF